MAPMTYMVDGISYGKNCDHCRFVSKAPCSQAGHPLMKCDRCNAKGITCEWSPAVPNAGRAMTKAGSQSARKPAQVNHSMQDDDEPVPNLPKARNKGRGLQKKLKPKEAEEEEAQSSGLSGDESDGEGATGPLKQDRAGKDNGRSEQEKSLPTSSAPKEKEKVKERPVFRESTHIRLAKELVVPSKPSHDRHSDASPGRSALTIKSEDALDPRDQSTAGPSKHEKKRDGAGSGFKKARRVVDSDDEDEDESVKADVEGGDGSAGKGTGGVGASGSSGGIMLRIPSQSMGEAFGSRKPKEETSSAGSGLRDHRSGETGDSPRTLSPGSKKRKRKEQEREQQRIGKNGHDEESSRSGADEAYDGENLRKKPKLKKPDRIAALKPSASSSGLGSAGPSTPTRPIGSSSPAPGTPDSQRDDSTQTPRSRADPDAMDIDKPIPSAKSTGGTPVPGTGTPGTPKEVRQRIPKKGMQGRPPAGDDLLTALFKTRTGGTTSGASTPNRASGAVSTEHAFAAVQRQEQTKRRAAILASQVTLDLMGSGSAIKRFESNPLNFPSRSTIYNPPAKAVDGTAQDDGYGSWGEGRAYAFPQGLPYDGPPPPPSASNKVPKSVEAVRRLLTMRDNGLLGI